MGKLSFGATGLSYQVDRPDLNVGGAPNCPRCQKRVYFNEERKVLGKSFHKICFACTNCKKALESTNVNSHEDDIYCTACHRKLFGIKGYGFAGGAAGLSTEKTARDMYRKSSSSSTTEIVPIRRDSTTTAKAQRANGFDGQKQGSVNTLASSPNSTASAPTINIDKEDPEKCPRCGRRVYFAEEVKANKRKWHRLCFKCTSCQKTLESGRCEMNEGEVYCNSCYAKNFGPKGYGFASSMVAANPNPHFHVKKEVARRTEPRTGSIPSSPGGSSSSASGLSSPAYQLSYSTAFPALAPVTSGADNDGGIAARAAPAPASRSQPANRGVSRYEMSSSTMYAAALTKERTEYESPNSSGTLPRSYEDQEEYDSQENSPYDGPPVSNSFTSYGEEWTDEKILNELNQFQQVTL